MENKFICTICDSEGWVVETFDHIQISIDAAEKFELMIMDAIIARDGKPRFFWSESNKMTRTPKRTPDLKVIEK